MAYVTFEYYKNAYRCGLSEVVPNASLDYYEKQARRYIDNTTFERVAEMPASDIPEAVKDAVCAVAEKLYKRDQATAMAEEAGASGVMTSYSNDGQSATFAADATTTDKAAFDKEIDRIIRDYLMNSGLLNCEAKPVELEVYDGEPPDQS